jgi:D-aminoacyl-tRNA deacylase
MILIVASTKDVAGMNIAQQILDNYGFEKVEERFHQNPVYSKIVQNSLVKLVFVNEEIVNTQFITEFFSPQLLVFISKHRSVSGLPTLSVHTPGNLSKAELGGIPRKVSVSPASAMRNALLEMANVKEELGLNYQVCYECTHHGPSLDAPAMFVELGSSMKQWKDKRAAEAVARAAMVAVSKQSKYAAVLGVGGPHYNAKFTRIALSKPIAFGHIIPKYAVSLLDADMVRQCVERTVEKVESVILDWKGIKGADKKGLMAILNDVGVSIEKV